MPGHGARRFILAAGCLTVVCGSVSSVFARDAFWQGRRGPFWEDGINPVGGKSNWYSRAQGGQAREVPNNFAIFPAGAQEIDVWITKRTRIQTIVIQDDAPRYDFTIRRNRHLVVSGKGIVTKSSEPPHFVIRKLGQLIFTHAARPISSGISAIIQVNEVGLLTFKDTSRGGNARLRNEGFVAFSGHASAAEMTIENGDTISDKVANMLFHDNSTAGSARITNLGVLDFRRTRGPKNDRKITAGTIANHADLFLGRNTLTVDSFVQEQGQANLHVEIKNNRSSGNLIVRGPDPLLLGGDLTVNLDASHDVAPGHYRVLYAEGGYFNSFTLHSAIPKSRLVHQDKEIWLVVDP